MPKRDPNLYLEGMDLVKELDQENVLRIRLNTPNSVLDEMSVNDRREKRGQMGRALFPLITDVWNEGYGFVVVCVGDVCAGNDPAGFDLRGLASAMDVRPILIYRPATVN